MFCLCCYSYCAYLDKNELPHRKPAWPNWLRYRPPETAIAGSSPAVGFFLMLSYFFLYLFVNIKPISKVKVFLI